MCRLFGLIANKAVDVKFSFLKADLSFKELGLKNPHGWGICFYENGNPKIFKEPKSIEKSKKSYGIIEQKISNLFISHVRRSSGTDIKYENSHPFRYKKWIFAHNGTIDIKNQMKEQLLPKFIKLLKGETDSEIFFYLIMQSIEQNKDIIEGIKEIIRFIKENKGSNTTSSNFLLTNGEKIYILRMAFKRKKNYTLYYLNRDPESFKEMKYLSKETRLLIRSKSLSGEKAIIICSEKLTYDENWIQIPNGTLIIVDENLRISTEKI